MTLRSGGKGKSAKGVPQERGVDLAEWRHLKILKWCHLGVAVYYGDHTEHGGVWQRRAERHRYFNDTKKSLK